MKRNQSYESWFAIVLAVTVVAAAGVPRSAAQGTSAFMALAEHYGAIRESLLAGTTEGVAEEALQLAEEAQMLAWDFSAERAGVKEADAGAVLDLLPDLRVKARLLAATTSLEEARAALSELTKPLVRYRKLLAGEGLPVVVYCPMAKKAWLQPEGEIGNPYQAESMPRCGEVILP